MAWVDTGNHIYGGGSGTAQGNARTAVLPSSVAAGSTIIVGVSVWDFVTNTAVAVSDNINGSYGSALFSLRDTSSDSQMLVAMYQFSNTGAGSTTISVSVTTGSSADISIFARAFTGGPTSAPSSGTPHTATGITAASGGPFTVSTGAMTPADNDALLCALIGYDSTNTTLTENAGSEGFSLSDKHTYVGGTGQPGSFVYKILSGAPGTPAHSWSLGGVSAGWAAGIAAFKPAVSGAVYAQTKFQLFNDDGTGLGPAP